MRGTAKDFDGVNTSEAFQLHGMVAGKSDAKRAHILCTPNNERNRHYPNNRAGKVWARLFSGQCFFWCRQYLHAVAQTVDSAELINLTGFMELTQLQLGAQARSMGV